MRLSFYGNTNIGRQRDHNEDSFLILCHLDNEWKEVNDLEIDLSFSKGAVFVVADGMGGANAGEVASEIAINTARKIVAKISSLPTNPGEIQKILSSIVFDGHNTIVKASQGSEVMQGMGTTIIVGFFVVDSLYVVWSGDSRCYVYNKNLDKELWPFTDDHSLVWERVKNKEISEEEARLSDDSNLILQSLGGALQKPEPDFKWIKLRKDDRILFCSDGLNSMLSSIGIQQILDFRSSPHDACDSLIRAACDAGGRDNITAIVIDVLNGDDIITEPDDRARKVKKKKPKILPILLVLAMITIPGILFRSEIKEFIGRLFIRNATLMEMRSGPPGDNKELDDQQSEIENISSIGIPENDANKNVVLITRDTKVSNNNRMILDSAYIETQMREAAIKINSIRRDIKMIEPEGALFNAGFYEEHKEKLDSILGDLEHQEKLLRSCTNLNSKNLLMKITDLVKANEIHKDIIITLNEIEKRTKDIINR